MGRRPRAKEFLFDPARWVEDDAVSTMSLEAAGAYARLFCRLWSRQEPGVVPDNDALLSALSQSLDRWPAIRAEVARAFDTTSRPGFWIQRALVETYQRQTRFITQQQAAGRASAKKRWSNVLSNDPNGLPVTPSVLGSRFSVLGESSQPPCSPDGERQVGLDLKAPEAPKLTSEVKLAFDEHFWPPYPRKVGHAVALKAWTALFRGVRSMPEAEKLLGRIMDGLERDIATEWRGREKDKIPHPSTWLNQRRWEDQR